MSSNTRRPAVSDNGILDPARILYADDLCVVVNKLPGEAAEGAAAGMGDLPRMIQRALCLRESGLLSDTNAAGGTRDIRETLVLPAAAHRLDVPVSGCALFARTRPALAFLNAAFDSTSREKTVEKRYWAIIEKTASDIPPAACLIHWLQFDPRKNKSFAHDEPGPGRKKAVLKYRLTGAGANYLFLEVELLSGRHHQIRCQFEKAGLHIKGDLKYGARRSEPSGGIRLHARYLAFPNPAGAGRVGVYAEPPLADNLWQAFTEAAADFPAC